MIKLARNWKDTKSAAVAAGKLDAERVLKRAERLHAEVRAHRLGEIRDAYGLTQVALAENIGVTQPRISNIERGELDHTEVATIRAYIEGIGGTFELLAKFGDEQVQIG